MLFFCLYRLPIVRTVGEAMSYPGRCEAMADEMAVLHFCGTRELVPQPAFKTLVGCRWIYIVQVGPNGNFDHLKACLIAKGYIQIFRT